MRVRVNRPGLAGCPVRVSAASASVAAIVIVGIVGTGGTGGSSINLVMVSAVAVLVSVLPTPSVAML